MSRLIGIMANRAIASLHGLCGLFVWATGCAGGAAPSAGIQQIVDSVQAKHTDLVRLTVHAVPAGKTQACAVASTAADKRGKPSDPEDLEAMSSGKEVVLDQGGNVDVTVPLPGMDGKNVGAVGVTLKAGSKSRDQLIGDARNIAQSVIDAVRAAKTPLW